MSDQSSLTDEQGLIAGALNGDEEALGNVLRTSQEWAYHVAYRVLGREADARDAVQDAFLLTVRALRGDGAPPRSTEGFRPWLRRVVVNAALAQVRKRPPLQPVPVDIVAETIPGADHDEPGRSTEREETRRQVLQALLALPETQRAALALREFLNASYDEIADTLGIPPTAVGTLLFRARAGFRGVFDSITETSRPVDCPDIVPLFSTIIDSQPPPAAWNNLEEHLRACQPCQSELEGQRRARRLYALLPLAALPAAWEPSTTALAAASNLPPIQPPRVADSSTHPDEFTGQLTPVGESGQPGVNLPAAVTGASETGSSPPLIDPGTSAPAAGLSAAGTDAAIGAASTGGTTASVAGGTATLGPSVTSAATVINTTTTATATSVATAGGFAGLAASAKLGIAALAAATVVGATVALGLQSSDERAVTGAPSPSPVPALAASPIPSPGAAASPGTVNGVTEGSVQGTPAAPAPAPLASPTVGASPATTQSTTTPAAPGPARVASPVASPTSAPASRP